MQRAAGVVRFVQQQGIEAALFRARYAIARKTGLHKRRFPAGAWADHPLSRYVRSGVPTDPIEYRAYRQSSHARFFFPLAEPPPIDPAWLTDTVEQADRIVAGEFPYFSSVWASLGDPPDWQLNPFTRQHFDRRHWCDRPDYDPASGDIKYTWEPSRFSWAYTLARAYVVEQEPEYAERFWVLWESWCDANPPQLGPSWQCGQECTLRVMAWLFALHVLWNDPATTPDRVARMAAMVGFTGTRIEGNIAYARSLKNNHTISEGVGLFTLGVLLPEFRDAQRWRTIGREILEQDGIDQFYSDFSHLQHSFNYLRFVLQMYTWALRLGQLNGHGLNKTVAETVRQSTRFLWQVQDESSGRVPNYGSNDGALVLPWSSCDYLDFRPALGSASTVVDDGRRYSPGSWEEETLWLMGARPGHIEEGDRRAPGSMAALEGGYFTLRGRETWAMVRCHTIRHRPLQADMLHVDLWWKGQNILGDSGTYRYHGEEPWCSYFSGTSAHNTIVIDGQWQMEKVSAFQWHPWTRSTAQYRHHWPDPEVEFWQGMHHAYERLKDPVTHRRVVLRFGEWAWCIVDDLLGQSTHTVTSFWHLLDVPYEIEDGAVALSTPAGRCRLMVFNVDASLEVYRGVSDPEPIGWESLHYGEMTPRPTVKIEERVSLPVRRITSVLLSEDASVGWNPYHRILTLCDGEHDFKVSLTEVDRYPPILCVLGSVKVGSMAMEWHPKSARIRADAKLHS